jgi:predicted transcriptional regulator
MSLYVDHTGEPQVDHTGEPVRAWNYARVPWEVVCDRRLKPLDIRVYCMISGPTFQATTARVGTRRIADCVHASRRLVIGSIRRLEDCGHIKRGRETRGKREMYIVTSGVFGQKQRAGIKEVISRPSRTPRLASVRRA